MVDRIKEVVIKVKGRDVSVVQLPIGISVTVKDYDLDMEFCYFHSDKGPPEEVWRIPIVR